VRVAGFKCGADLPCFSRSPERNRRGSRMGPRTRRSDWLCGFVSQKTALDHEKISSGPPLPASDSYENRYPSARAPRTPFGSATAGPGILRGRFKYRSGGLFRNKKAGASTARPTSSQLVHRRTQGYSRVDLRARTNGISTTSAGPRYNSFSNSKGHWLSVLERCTSVSCTRCGRC
jgi:hypothetical protein